MLLSRVVASGQHALLVGMRISASLKMTLMKGGAKMYSPKIREDLIPLIYQIKQAQAQKTMTQIVDEILRPAVRKLHETLVTYNSIKEGGEKDALR